MNCKLCKETPFHPDKKCCFNCGKDADKCRTIHLCGDDCKDWYPSKAESIRTVLKQAIETYGAEAQLNVAIEEFAELTKEICKHKRYADNITAIIEEMADCYIMLEQMQMIFGLGSTVISDAMDKKIHRLKCRLDNIPAEKKEGVKG